MASYTGSLAFVDVYLSLALLLQ